MIPKSQKQILTQAKEKLENFTNKVIFKIEQDLVDNILFENKISVNVTEILQDVLGTEYEIIKKYSDKIIKEKILKEFLIQNWIIQVETKDNNIYFHFNIKEK